MLSGDSMGISKKPYEDREVFQSKFGLIVTCLGCVVGTGNVWRFPRILANASGDTGGLVFIILWAFFLVLWSIPMILLEYGTGRYSGRAVVGSFQYFLGNKTAWCGGFVTMVKCFISGYYAVVVGWCMYYIVHCIKYELPIDVVESRAIFRDFAEESAWPVLTASLAILVAALSISKGVKTIEKANMVFVPVLLMIVVFNFFWSVTRRGAGEGVKFIFTPNWSAFGDPRIWVDALSQNAFDTGAGMGLLVPYATYMTSRHTIVKYGTLIPPINNIVSLLCGMTVFATVFSTLLTTVPDITRPEIIAVLADSGPASTGLAFIWMPVLYSSLGIFGRVLSVLFFICLCLAGITSLISDLELVCHTTDDFGLSRKYGVLLSSAAVFLIGIASALNIDILSNQDFVWSFALVINGFFFQSMVILYGAAQFRLVCYNAYANGDWKLPKVWEYAVKFVLPIEGALLILWWAIDLIQKNLQDGIAWYSMSGETFFNTIVQWATLLAVLVIVNICVLYFIKVKNRRIIAQSSRPDPVGARFEESGKLLLDDVTPPTYGGYESALQSTEFVNSVEAYKPGDDSGRLRLVID